jgi:hypothetical protein
VPRRTQRDGSLAATLLRLIDREAESDDPGMSKDDEGEGRQSESDGLEALASGLEANESEDAEEDLDLASLAAVVGARAPSSAGEQAAPEEVEKLVLAAAPPAPAAAPREVSAPAAPPARERGWLVPMLVVFALGVGAMGYVLGRSSRPEELDAAARAPAAPLDNAEPPAPSAPVVAAAPAPAPSVPVVAAPASPVAFPNEGARPPAPIANPRAVRPSVAAAPAAAPVAREQGEPSAVAAAVAVPAAEKPAEAPAVLAKTEPSPSRSVDDLLDEALSPGARPAAAPTSTALPEAPSREEVTDAMAVLLPAIRGCAMGQTGLATAGIVVRGDGRVASVELSGAPFEGTASGRCMEGVLRRARFSRFRQPTFRVRFPFAIQ